MPEPRASRHALFCRSFRPWLVVAAGLLVTTICFFWARKIALVDFRGKFEEQAKARAGIVVRGLDESMQALKDVGQFCQKKEPTNDSFSAFAAFLLRRHPQIGVVAWVPRTAAASRASHEQTGKKVSSGSFHATEFWEFSHPILFMQPEWRGRKAAALDLASDSVLLAAVERARDSGEPAAVTTQESARVFGHQSAFSIILPVYGKRQLTNIADRRKSLLGFVFGALRTDGTFAMFQTGEGSEGFDVELLDLSVDYGERKINKWSAPAGRTLPSFRSRLLPACPPYLLRFFSGKEWGVKITPGPVYIENNYDPAYWLFLLGGVALTLPLSLLALYVRAILSQRESTEKAVRELTADLRGHEQSLEKLVGERTESLSWKSAFLEALTNSSEDGILVIDPEGTRIFHNPRFVHLWRIPEEVVEGNDEKAWMEHVLAMVRDPVRFEQTVQYSRAHPDGSVCDEVELYDGTVFERRFCPVVGADGRCYGRVLRFRDITERRKAEEALRESEERYRIAIENSNDGIALASKGKNYFVNRRFLEIFGYDREEEAIGNEGLFTVHPDDRERVSDMIAKRARKERVPARYEFRGIRKNGTEVEVEVTVATITYRGNDVSLVNFHDITERKNNERALRESENKFRDLAEKSIVGVYLIQDGLFRYVNSRFAEIHGYTPEEFIDRIGVEETAAREDIPSVQEGIRKRMSGEIDLVRSQFRIVTKQGGTRDVEIYGTHTTYQGRRAIIGTLLDVTERKQTEAALGWKTAFLEAQVASSLDGIIVVDSQGSHILQNQRAIDMWKVPWDVLDDQDHTRRFGHIVGMAKHAAQFREKVELLRRNPDLTSRDEIELINGTILDTYSCPVRGEDGNYYGRIWTFRDVTELRHYWDMLENLSATDGLTDLPNRRRFDDFLSREWRRSMRDQSLLSLVLMDIDFFKEFNDHYGHLAGDDCLRHVARMLRETVQRPGDLVARYGGEEFACILPDTGQKGAVMLANRIRDRIKESNVPHFFSSVADHVTLSFGVATIVPSKGESPAALIQLADKLLYTAKQNGRDRVINWQQLAKGRRVNEK